MNFRMVRCGKVNFKRENDNLLITGDGRTLPDDLAKFFHLQLPHDVMAIGRSIKMSFGEVKHWVNVDGPGSKWWAEHLPGQPIRHTIGECAGYDCIWDDGLPDGEPWYGSSSLFAALIGLTLGYKALFLAGCPMDMEGHWYFGKEHRGPEWREEDFEAWREFTRLPMPGIVRSLSGFTKEVLCQQNQRNRGE